MAEELEITNVGGKDGVASEATLKMLLESFDKLAKGKGTDAKKAKEQAKKYHDELKNGIEIIKDEKKARKENNEAIDDATSRLNAFAKSSIGLLVTGFSAVTGSLYNFGEELVIGGNRLSDFAQHVPLVGQYLSILTGIVDDSVDTFRELSQVGATFAGGLTEFRRLAGEASMPLDEFRRLVQENSESLKLFGTDTAMGARNFAAMSNEFRRGVGKELLNLGFTSSELNNTLLDFAEIQAMIFGAERAQSMITTQNAGEFAHQLQRLSAITGKRRDQIAEEMMQTMSDARARMAIASMDVDARKRFQANLAQTPEALKSVFVDMADGIPNEELTQRLLQFSDTFREQAGNIQNMSEREFNNFLVGVRDDLETSGEIMGDGFQSIIANVPGLADAFASMTELQQRRILGEEAFNEMLEEQRQARERDDSILQFGETLNQIRGNLQVAFVESGILQVVEDLAAKFTDFLSDPKTIDGLKSALESVSTFLNNFIKDVNENGLWQTLMTRAVDTIVEGVSTWWSDSSLITKTMVIGAGALFVAGGPIASAFISGIAALFASSAVKNATGAAASSLFSTKKLSKLLKFGMSLPFLATTLAVTPSELGDGTVTGNVDRQMTGEGLTPENMGNEAWQIERERRINDFLENVGDASDVENEYLRSLSEKIAVEQDRIKRSLSGENVYTGFEGRGRSRSEATITSLLDQIDRYQSQLDETSSKQEDTGTIISNLSDTLQNNTANQGNSEAIQELNNTMMQILAVLRQTKTIDEKIAKNTSSIGGNIANGRVSNIR